MRFSIYNKFTVTEICKLGKILNMKVIIAVVLNLWTLSIFGQTTVIVFYDYGTIYIGADSKVPTTLYGKENGKWIKKDSSYNTCKIVDINGIGISGSGKRLDDLIQIAKTVRYLGSFENFFKSFSSRAIKYLEDTIGKIKRYEPLRFKDSYLNSDYDYVTEMVFCMFENTIPKIIRVRFDLQKNTKDKIKIDTLVRRPILRSAKDGNNFIIGISDCVQIKPEAIDSYDENFMKNEINRLINSAIKCQNKKVGPPISILKMSAAGNKFIQGGLCK